MSGSRDRRIYGGKEAIVETERAVLNARLGQKTTEASALREEVATLNAKIAALEALTPPMPEGAVVMLDALGFKGVWRRHPGGAEAVLAKMRRIRETVGAYRATADATERALTSIRCECISDTIVLGVTFRNEGVPDGVPPVIESFKSGTVIAHASRAASVVCEIGLDEEPALAYRGCITYGQFEMKDGFIIGPAVDEAAEQMELAEGALIWCAPSALARMTPFTPGAYAMYPFTVPLKQGRTFDTQCVVPYSVLGGSEKRTAMIERLLGTFDKGAGLAIAIKKQNTEKFLRIAEAAVREPGKASVPVGFNTAR